MLKPRYLFTILLLFFFQSSKANDNWIEVLNDSIVGIFSNHEFADTIVLFKGDIIQYINEDQFQIDSRIVSIKNLKFKNLSSKYKPQSTKLFLAPNHFILNIENYELPLVIRTLFGDTVQKVTPKTMENSKMLIIQQNQLPIFFLTESKYFKLLNPNLNIESTPSIDSLVSKPKKARKTTNYTYLFISLLFAILFSLISYFVFKRRKKSTSSLIIDESKLPSLKEIKNVNKNSSGTHKKLSIDYALIAPLITEFDILVEELNTFQKQVDPDHPILEEIMSSYEKRRKNKLDWSNWGSLCKQLSLNNIKDHELILLLKDIPKKKQTKHLKDYLLLNYIKPFLGNMLILLEELKFLNMFMELNKSDKYNIIQETADIYSKDIIDFCKNNKLALNYVHLLQPLDDLIKINSLHDENASISGYYENLVFKIKDNPNNKKVVGRITSFGFGKTPTQLIII